MAYINRADAIKSIKVGLKKLTGRSWNVSGNRGTAYGYINIDAPKARRNFDSYGKLLEQVDSYAYMGLEDRRALAQVFKCGDTVHFQGMVCSPDEREFTVAAAEGRIKPCANGNGWEIDNGSAVG